MQKATQVATSIEGLDITIGKDGVWLHFAADGKQASINLNNMAEERGRIIGAAITAWCKKTKDHYVDPCEGCNSAPADCKGAECEQLKG